MWFSQIPCVAIVALWVLVPGIVALAPLRLRHHLGITLAPAVSISLIAVGALFSPFLGRFWPLSIIALSLSVAVCSMVWSRHNAAEAHEEKSGWGPLLGASLIAFLLTALFYRRITRTLDSFSLTWDNAFHLATTRHIWASGEASSLYSSSYLYAGHPAVFYPSAFHDFAALALHASGGAMQPAIHATIVVIIGIAWPLSLLAGVSLLWGSSEPALIGVGILAAASPLFPFFLLDFGVLYANVLALCLTPVLIGLVAVIYGLSPSGAFSPATAIALLGLALPGVALSHPSAVIAAALFTLPGALTAGIRWLRRLRRGDNPRWLDLMLVCAHICGAIIAWYGFHPEVSVEFLWPPFSTPGASALQVLSSVPLHHRMVPIALTLLVACGLIRLVLSRQWWFLAGYVLLVTIYLYMCAAETGLPRWIITRVWYQDYYRFSSVVGLVSILIACWGWAGVIAACQRLIPHVTALPLLLTLSLALVTQLSAAQFEAVTEARKAYTRTDLPASPHVVTTSKYKVIEAAGSHVPEGHSIANVPGTGSELAYPLLNREVLIPYLAYYIPTTEQIYLNDHLRDAASNPRVCEILRARQMDYALDFGAVDTDRLAYRGWVELAKAPGFEVIYQDGENRLLRITACHQQ